MDLYTDCPECESKGYDTDTRICKRCIGTTFIPVRVKALEWESAYQAWVGEIYNYTISGVSGCYGIWWYDGDKSTYFGSYTTLDAAKAACQAHHERMVMDMLENCTMKPERNTP